MKLPSLPACAECGMIVEPGEYHPFAACLMFKASHSSATVRENLKAIRDSSVDYCAMVCDGADKNTHPSDLADQLRSLKDR